MGKEWRKGLFLSILLGLWPLCFSPVAQAVTKISAEEIRTKVTHFVEGTKFWPQGAFRLVFPLTIRDGVFPYDGVTLEVQGRPHDDFIGETTVSLRYLWNGRCVKEEQIPITIEVLFPIVLAAAPIAKGKEITAEDLMVVKRWMRRFPTGLVTSPEEAKGKTSAITLRKGSEIRKEYLREPLLVRRGEMVRIVVECKNLFLTASGISEEDGWANKVIRIKNPSSQKVIYGRVVGSSLVKIEL